MGLENIRCSYMLNDMNYIYMGHIWICILISTKPTPPKKAKFNYRLTFK